MKGDFLMKIRFTDLLNHYQDDTIDIKEKSVVDSADILKRTSVVNSKNHITMTKRSLSILLASAVLMMSGVTVYAVESGAIDSLKSYFNNKDVPYSYSGTYNQIDENYIYENISTDFTTEVVSDSSKDTHIEITGYVADEYNMYIIGNVVFNNNDLGSITGFKNLYAYESITPFGTYDYELYSSSKFYNMVKKDVGIFVTEKDLDTINLEEKYPISNIKSNFLVDENGKITTDEDINAYVDTDGISHDYVPSKYVENLGYVYWKIQDDNTQDNIIPIVYIVNSHNVQIKDIKSIDISIHSLSTSYNYRDNGAIIDETIRVNFNKNTMTKNIDTMTNTIKNLNIDCDDYTIDSITYSPLGLNMSFKEDIISVKADWYQKPYFNRGKYEYPTINLIYNDGTKVFQNNDYTPVTSGYADKYIIDTSYSKIYDTQTNEPIGQIYTLGEYINGLNYNFTQPVDYTNVVSMEINGTVIPLTK